MILITLGIINSLIDIRDYALSLNLTICSIGSYFQVAKK